MTKEEKEKHEIILKNIISQKWEPEKNIEEFYNAFNFTRHYGLYHNGYEYFITFDVHENKERIVIYSRDLSDEKYAYNSSWENEPKNYYDDVTQLAFNFKLQNDGRTIAEYICDYYGKPRILL